MKMEDDESEDLTICQICCEEYDLNLRIPRFLPCTHTICETCICHILNLESKGVVTCPECRKDHAVGKNQGVQSFHQNKYILAHIRKVQKQQGRQEEICQKHNRPFSLYCEEERCKVIICTKCLVKQHNGHTTSDIIEKADSCRKQLKEEISQMVDTLNNNRQKGREAMLRLFQSTHETLNSLEERKASLNTIIDEHVKELEDQAIQNYKTQASAINKQDQQLTDAMKEVSSHVTDFTNLRSTDILRQREEKRLICQEIVHNTIKSVGFNDEEELFSLKYEPTECPDSCDATEEGEKFTLIRLVGGLKQTPAADEDLSCVDMSVQKIKDECACNFCAGRKLLLSSGEEMLDDALDILNEYIEWPDEGAIGGDDDDYSTVIDEIEAASDEMEKCSLRPVSVYSAGDYSPSRPISFIRRVDQFADLCPEPPTEKPKRIPSKVLRLMPLLSGQLQSFGDYGLYYIQSKTFSDDQYKKDQLFESSCWRDSETVNCEEELIIEGQKYVAIASLHSLRTHYVVNFHPKDAGRRYCVDLSCESVCFFCLLDCSVMIYAYSESESAGLANMVFLKIGFLQYSPVPELRGGDFTTDYTSLRSMCTLTHGPQPLILLCGNRTDLENPGVPCLTAYTNEGQALWRRSLLDPHSICSDSFGNLFVAAEGDVLLFDANGSCICKLLSSEKDKLGTEADIRLVFRSEQSQLVVSHVCRYSDVKNVKGVTGKYDPITVYNFYMVGYRDD